MFISKKNFRKYIIMVIHFILLQLVANFSQYLKNKMQIESLSLTKLNAHLSCMHKYPVQIRS